MSNKRDILGVVGLEGLQMVQQAKELFHPSVQDRVLVNGFTDTGKPIVRIEAERPQMMAGAGSAPKTPQQG